MKLKEAIKVVKLYTKGVPKHNRTDFEDALELLLEAGERIQRWRGIMVVPFTNPLPGETPEAERG